MELTQEREGHSVARLWNEVILDAIRNDYARPTVHARNLFHLSGAMYDSWAAFRQKETPYLAGTENCSINDLNIPDDILPLQEKAISYATYTLLKHRFANSPGAGFTLNEADTLMLDLDYDKDFDSTDFVNSSDTAAALGNFIAQCYINHGLTDGSNEQNGYANLHYRPVNPNLKLNYENAGNPTIIDMNRWQRIELENFIDQAGNPVTDIPEFLSPEWGNVKTFSLTDDDKTTYTRDGVNYNLYHDPGQPPLIGEELEQEYKWGFALVSAWSSHLDETDGVMWDISPASLGNIQSFPDDFRDFDQFYDLLQGGDSSQGYQINPTTSEPYEPQMVPRGDYARVLAEFWADGPDSETPPGHWYVILNSVSDHPQLEKRWAGEGDVLGNLEWDIKTYFSLGGTMHDAAIAAWSVKGWYDYIRPVSAIRAMSDLGQSSDPNGDSYHPQGIPLISGLIELVVQGDPLAGENNEHLGKIKVYAWKGPAYIDNPLLDRAGVDWILAEQWWPYQRPSFVTPPFAGYVSGHSTFSRAAAELMTRMTGDAYFPGGMSGFEIKANDFLVFEKGPSVDMTLQWATYQDASDQCSLSRIWGGIHPPADDLPGRHMGMVIGPKAFDKANSLFSGN
ncbi:MAG: vanadium-dependent haloperoxidase [Gammaproteobacteria bacterium]|nr:vanadium-dependent haloperoxidase [Gammaproteobacteria bacterium]